MDDVEQLLKDTLDRASFLEQENRALRMRIIDAENAAKRHQDRLLALIATVANALTEASTT
jgi:hypothetical protein